MSFKVFLCLSIPLLLVAIQQILTHWKVSVPPGVEDADIVKNFGVHLPILLTLNHILWYLGVKDIFWPDRIYRKWLYPSRTCEPGTARMVQCQEAHWDDVKVLIFQNSNPSNSKGTLRKAIVYFHGGGYVLGSAHSYAPLTAKLALETNTVVISVDYRLAPEHFVPTAFDDAERATRHLFQIAHKSLEIDPTQIYLAGDSAGGLTAISVAIRLHHINVTARGVVLFYPPTQMLTFRTPSYETNQNDFLLPSIRALYFRMLYLQGNAHDNFEAFHNNALVSPTVRERLAEKFQLDELRNQLPMQEITTEEEELVEKFRYLYEDERLSPLLVNDLSTFPRTFLLTCEYDILRDDGIMLLRRLQAAQRPVRHVNKACFHGMMSYFQHYQPAQQVMNEVVAFVNS